LAIEFADVAVEELDDDPLPEEADGVPEEAVEAEEAEFEADEGDEVDEVDEAEEVDEESSGVVFVEPEPFLFRESVR
jgi:hypothetical protein